MKKFSRIRYPNRRERRHAFRQSSLSNWMAWGPLHKRKLEYMKETIFRPNPLWEYLTKESK